MKLHHWLYVVVFGWILGQGFGLLLRWLIIWALAYMIICFVLFA